jgi:hypothetical protein
MHPVHLSMTEAQRSSLLAHLFPSDHCEAVAIALCGRAVGRERNRLLVRRLEMIPYEVCKVRAPDQVTWPTQVLLPWLEEARRNNWGVVKIHGHRGYPQFSSTDDISDRDLFPSLYAWTESIDPHASLILMQDGSMFGRVVTEQGHFVPLESITVVGDDIAFYRESNAAPLPEFGRRIAQSFGKGTFEILRALRVAVVGCSGTGSPVIEQLARNCVGALVLVDPDVIEEKNLNRILNATMEDALAARPKVEVAARSVTAMGLGTHVVTFAKSLFDVDVVRAVASCDVIFGCMDSIDGRHLLNKLATFYMQPYLDLGVKIEADGQGGVEQVAASVHYLKPGGSSLASRHVFSMEQVRVAGLKRTDPERYKGELEEGYVRGVPEDRPAVIQLNTLVASLAVSELLARLHPYRQEPNGDFAVTRVSLTHDIWDHEADGAPCQVLSRQVGRGDTNPMLDWAELTVHEERA